MSVWGRERGNDKGEREGENNEIWPRPKACVDLWQSLCYDKLLFFSFLLLIKFAFESLKLSKHYWNYLEIKRGQQWLCNSLPDLEVKSLCEGNLCNIDDMFRPKRGGGSIKYTQKCKLVRRKEFLMEIKRNIIWRKTR